MPDDDLASSVTQRFEARLRDVFPSTALADALENVRAIALDADEDAADGDFESAFSTLDSALKALASSDVPDSHLDAHAQRLRLRAFVARGRAALALGDAEAALSLSHEAFGESAFDGGDAATTTEVLRVNAMAHSALGNREASVLVCVDALARGCDVSDGFPEDAATDARRRREAPCDTPLDRFVMLVMRLNRTDEDRQRIAGALEMLERGFIVDSRDESGHNVLWGALMGAAAVAADEGAAAGEETVAVLRMLLERGARANQRYDSGETPLHLAASSGVLGAVAAVLEHGGDPNARNDDGRTPLMLACARKLEESERPHIVETLVSCGTNVEARDSNGLTALHIACKCGNDVVVEALLRCKADWRARTPKLGESAVMLAYTHARASGVIAEILKYVESLEGEAAMVGETEFFRATSPLFATTTAAVRCVKEDISLAKWCEREKEISACIAKVSGVTTGSVDSGKIIRFPEDASWSPEARQEVTALYFRACDFELDDDDDKSNVAVSLYRKYGDVLSAFIRFNHANFPMSLGESYADGGETLPIDFVARALYASKQASGSSTCVGVSSSLTPTKLHSPVYVAFMTVMSLSVDRTFHYAPFITDNAKAWLMAESAFICVSRGGAYTAARLRDALNVPTTVILLRSDDDATPACFVEDATVIEQSKFRETRLDSHSHATLLVELVPGDTELLELAIDSYGGTTLTLVNARSDDAECEAVACARGFKEDARKRAPSFVASGRPFAFSRWTKSP